MLLPRLQPPLRAALTSIGRSSAGGSQTTCLNEAFTQLSIRAPYPGLIFVRHASHAQQGAVNKAKDGPGKRLGAKRSGGMSSFPIHFLITS
jgi:large subunit ribosomal protein L27